MAKITKFYCDFNDNLPDHEAQFAVIIDEDEKDRRLELEFCAEHLVTEALILAKDNRCKMWRVRGSLRRPRTR